MTQDPDDNATEGLEEDPGLNQPSSTKDLPTPGETPLSADDPTKPHSRVEEDVQDAAATEGGGVIDGDATIGPNQSNLQKIPARFVEDVRDLPKADVRPIPERDRIVPFITNWLIWILAGTVFVHYLSKFVIVLLLHSEPPESVKEISDSFDRIFTTVLPVLSGLVGSIVSYYFAREKSES